MDIILSRFYKFLVESIPYIVVKMPAQAKQYETVESKRAGDIYVAAMMGTDSIYSYQDFDEELMYEAGFNALEIKTYKRGGSDASTLDNDSRRKTLLDLSRKKYIAEYEETNDYYRMLNGLPGYNDKEEIWFDDFDIYDRYGIDPCPVHEISHTILIAMESRGELEPLKKSHPEATYLNHLGHRRIDYVTARQNDAFALLYFPNFADNYSFYRDFVTYYENCREYFLTVVYNQYFMAKYDNYDGYIGFMILTMTINKIINGNYKAFIERDFYDSLSTATFLNAYGIYYDDRLTLSQTKLIAKNLNILLMNKSTDVALLDVLDLLGFHDYTLMKYYLIKSHRVNSEGEPEFPEKTITHEDGTTETVFDTDNLYDFKFVKVPVGTNNLQEALDNMENILSYQSVTQEDPYWIEDDALIEKLKDMKFNYIDTKYMDLTIVYRMYAIMFEITYFTRLILDRKNETQNILVNMAKISLADISIFDVMILLICLTCKFYKFKPVILKSPDKILRILGFNFEADLEAIRKDIESNPKLYDQELLRYLDTSILTKASDINAMYKNIKNFDRKLISLMNNASDLKSYRAYKKLYETLMYIRLNPDLYALNDGTVPETYTEYLEEHNPELYKLLSNTEGEDACSELINYITSRLSTIFTNTKYLKYIQVVDDSLIDSILKILEFFKSYTVQFRGANIVLLFDSRIYNMAHLYHKFEMDANETMLDVIGDGDARYWDMVKEISSTIVPTEEEATEDEIMKAMSDMMHRIDLYMSWKMYMKDVHMILPDKTNLGVLFEIPVHQDANMEISLKDLNLETMLTALEEFDPRIDLTTSNKMTENVDLCINRCIFAGFVELFEYAKEFATQKLVAGEREKFMVKLLRNLTVKIPSRLFTSINIDIHDKTITKQDIVREFREYESTLDVLHITKAIELFITDMIRKVYIRFNDYFKAMQDVKLSIVQKYYMRNVLRFLSEYTWYLKPTIEEYYKTIESVMVEEDVNIVHKLLYTDSLETIRLKYRFMDIPTMNIALTKKEPLKCGELLYSRYPYQTSKNIELNQSTDISIRDDYIQFIWSE